MSGKILPKSRAFVTLYSTETPYSTNTVVFPGSSFHFKNLQPGSYTVAIFVRGRGEARRTVVVGPGTADRHGRVSLQLDLKDSDFVLASAAAVHTVSTKELSIPDAAWRDYRNALKSLAKHDPATAITRLEDAVERAPQFSAAWNNLGTIAYQTGNYARAEECFREALAQNPSSYEALVNLGGVLVTLHKLAEALDRNSLAATMRPNDALAQSQLGLTYFLLGRLDLAKKHLALAREIDPAHFTNPQLALAEIDIRQGDRHAAADALDDFLAHHPDWPQAARMRQTIVGLRSY
ncbi:MAG TPA: tetratricopeptide repeat protein [Bryobacteraceae bacterium]